jgi:hypothetical protein
MSGVDGSEYYPLADGGEVTRGFGGPPTSSGAQPTQPLMAS